MNTVPEPIAKGLFKENATGIKYWAFFLKHNEDACETSADDCYLTVSQILEGGEDNCGQSGIYPVERFKSEFTFICFPKPGDKKF